MANMDYALEKFTVAVYRLATYPGDVRSRLYYAFESLAPVRTADLPEELQADFEWVLSRLTKHETEGQGKVWATLNRMRNATGVKIATRIVEIEAKLRTRLESGATK